MGDLPLDHIARPPLPWRDAERTECGRLIRDVASVVPVEEIERKIARQGQQRAAFTTCMTCASTSDRWPDWDTDPAGLISRWTGGYWRSPDDERRRLNRELQAIAALVDAHRDEFDATVAGLADAPSLADRRRRQGRR